VSPFVTWDFFPDEQAVLLDKVYKFESTAIELGGVVTAPLINPDDLSTGLCQDPLFGALLRHRREKKCGRCSCNLL
jgi:hypothetical protein